MTVLGTQMHVITFLILAVESAMLFFQIIYFLFRPKDKSRSRYLILLLFFIQYNLLSGLFPDESFSLPVRIQIILAYYGGVTVSIFFLYYIYVTFELEKIKYYSTKGAVAFIFLPFIVLFVVPYMITGDLEQSRKLIVVAPFVFALFFIYTLSKALWERYQQKTDKVDREEIIGVYLGALLWCTLPVIVYFDAGQQVENSITNTGFLIMSVLFVRSSIIKSKNDDLRREEYALELKKLNKNLQKKVEERTRQLEDLNEQQKNSFINLVHETKTPLTLINNYLGMYIQKNGPSEDLNHTKMSLEKLNRNLDTFFDINKLMRGVHIYDHSSVSDFSAILKENLKMFTPLANQKRIQLISDVESDIFIKADPEAINRIIRNLVENAFKYSNEKGLIEVKLSCANNQIFFVVVDNGRGILKEFQDKIFQPYYQISHKKSNSQGIGMGLSIVSKTVESLNGKIELVSKKGKGTKVTIILEKYDISNQDAGPISRKVTGFTGNQPTVYHLKDSISSPDFQNILLVEDNSELLNFLINQLKINYNVLVAKNGIEAISKLKNLPNPDLIISDIMMDEMDGIELIKVLRNQERYQHIPIVFLTALSSHEDILHGLSLGAVDFISKPFHISELKEKIKSQLSNISNQRYAIVNQAVKNLGKVYNPDSFKIELITLDEKCKKLKLTKRETEITKFFIEGKSYKEVGELLFIAEKTVSKHVSNIFGKLSIKNRFELINLLETM